VGIVGWKLPTLAAVLWVIALTVVSVMLGLVIAGPYGTLIGAIPLALGAVLAGYVPLIREAAHRRHQELMRLNQQRAAAQATWDAVGEPIMETTNRGPAALLRADCEIVKFTGRNTELDALRSWCVTADARSVRTIVGPGGVGKTRLALEVASEWESHGGTWRRVDAGQEAQAVAAARALTAGPVLLVLDYAETRIDLEALLRAVLGDRGPIRVLLVARALGEWWDRLIEKSAPAVGRLLTEGKPILLGVQISQKSSDIDLVIEAVPQFAHALKCAAPVRVEFEPLSHHVPVLVLHTAALIAVLRSQDDPAASFRVVVAEGLLDELLIHEARYWRRAAAATGLPEDGTLLKAVVAAAALLGAANLAEATAMVARVPDLADAPQALRRSWARWLYGLYPADSEGRLGSLQPDLLAETHVVRQLTSDTSLATACLSGLPFPQAVHALTVLARAWTHQDGARKLIADALHADLAHLALPAAVVALQTRSALGKLLAAALWDAPAAEDVLIEVARTLPYPSVVLDEARLAASWRVRQSLPNNAEQATVAEWSRMVGNMLSHAGRLAEALPMAEEAVATYRDLADADPGRYRLDLAQSLINLGFTYVMLGRADAVPAFEETVAIYRDLADADPDRYRPDLAQSLNDLGAGFGELARPDEALPVEQEAVATRRDLADADPDRYRPGLAQSLNNLGNRLSELGRFTEALPIAEQAVAIRRELADADPDRYRPDLAQSLNNFSSRLSDLGRFAEALPIAEQAVAIYRDLAATNPDTYRPELARCLNNLGVKLSKLDCHADAVPVGKEAVAIRRDLAVANPGRYRPDVAQSLNNLSVSLSGLGSHADALDAAQEAVAIYRQLVPTNPGYRSGLAQSLGNLGKELSELGRLTEALTTIEQAVAMYRDLVDADPDRYRSDPAQFLDNLAEVLATLPAGFSGAEQIRGEVDRLRHST
jgi:tetratricopeptide (TPR) repeat protein